MYVPWPRLCVSLHGGRSVGEHREVLNRAEVPRLLGVDDVKVLARRVLEPLDSEPRPLRGCCLTRLGPVDAEGQIEEFRDHALRLRAQRLRCEEVDVAGQRCELVPHAVRLSTGW